MKTRREFIQLSAAALGGVALSSLDCNNMGRKKLDSFGIQLYSVRDVFEKDPRTALQQVASFGYKQVESYERNNDMFWGLTNKGFKKYMDDLGMELISSHCEPGENFERKAEQAAEIGMKYLVYNWPYAQQPMEEYKRKADLFNECGVICKKAGIRFGYHNYESSYQLVDGEFPQDVIMKRTDASLVDHQMDIYWVVNGGQDPVAWIKKYPNRYRLCHIKDRVKNSAKREDTCDLGSGSINFIPILEAAKENGMQYYLAEQEHYPNSTPMKSAQANADYLRNIKI